MKRAGRRLDIDTEHFRGPVLVRENGPADGQPVLLLHGFCGSNTWFDRVTAELFDTFRVVRLDLLGHGGTGGHAADAPLQAEVAEGVLDLLGVTSGVTVVGHSFGADVAVELAERSRAVDRTVIVTQAPDYSDAVLPRAGVLMTTPVVRTALHRVGKLGTLGLDGFLRVHPPKDPATRILAPQALADFRALDTAMFGVVLDQRRARLDRRPLDEQLRDTGKPALVMLGGNDHFYGDRSAPRYRAAGARVEIVPDGGHSLQIERPELVALLIREFATEAVAAG